jgi:hypothetical protein
MIFKKEILTRNIPRYCGRNHFSFMDDTRNEIIHRINIIIDVLKNKGREPTKIILNHRYKMLNLESITLPIEYHDDLLNTDVVISEVSE